MSKRRIIALAGTIGTFAPILAFAQPINNCNSVGIGTLSYILCKVSLLLNTIIPILITLGVVYFIWGVISYVMAKEEEAKKEGRSRMIYGLIGLVVIVSIWGLVAILKNTFGVANTSSIQVPCIETPGNPC